MSFVAELKQRKVIRVAMVYLVVAWVAIQAASIGLPAFDAPPWILRVVILLFALGLPLALLLTWALQLTPNGVKLVTGKVGNKRMAAISLGLAALALAWYFAGQPALRNRVVPERSIAVLPFVNMSGNPTNDYFSDGLSETTLDMLAQVSDLKVIARTSSFAFKGKAEDVRRIGKALGATHLLEGSVQQAGDTVRITAQLIDTRDGRHLWSGRYDRKLVDIFRIQDEIATEVVKAMQGALPATEQERLVLRRTGNVAAYDEYLKGNALLPQRKPADLRKALKHFERATMLDPLYARAHVGVAVAIQLLRDHASTTPEQDEERRQHVERALELAPALGEAHVASATLIESSGDFRGAERAYRRGLELAPSYAAGHQWYGEFLLNSKDDVQGALRQMERAAALDPFSPIILNELAIAQIESGRLEEAEATTARVLERHPHSALGNSLLAIEYYFRGDLVGVLRASAVVNTYSPESWRQRYVECGLLASFALLPEADDCYEHLRARFGDNDHLRAGRADIAFLRQDLKQARIELESLENPSVFAARYAGILSLTGDAERALSILHESMPELFRASPGGLDIDSPSSIEQVATALLHGNRKQQAETLLRRGLVLLAARNHYYGTTGRGWNEVLFHAFLGEPRQACAGMDHALQAGYFTDFLILEAHPDLAALRQQPCYVSRIAILRAKVQVQVQRAREAGLLG